MSSLIASQILPLFVLAAASAASAAAAYAVFFYLEHLSFWSVAGLNTDQALVGGAWQFSY